MKTIYKEEYCHRKLPTIIGIFFLLAIIIPINDMLRDFIDGGTLADGITSALVFTILVAIVTKLTIRFKYKYKISLISNQLIIYKISKREQHVEHNIKVKDIISIKKINTFRFLLLGMKYNCYLCSIFNGGIYYCIYKSDDREKMFFFHPSSTLINKIEQTIKDEYKCKVS
ncbi:hypothetical protein [Clostridium thermarum]|uniref:hypothetical protein n=1 Tax=Clostridium thermarum TaxID=1716543 RepID=UPI0011221F37|nr:hypothetical protein [Clostridium thermarum]